MSFNVTPIGRDTSLRLSCRNGDQVIWWRWLNILAQEPDVRDVWQLQDQDWILVTTRSADLPSWFDRRPRGDERSYAHTLKRVRAGELPPEPLEGPHIWRVLAGDRITWT